MRKFNLEDALNGKEVFTRDGRPVTIAGFNPTAPDTWKIAGWVGDCGKFWREDGRYYINNESEYDLFTENYSYINIHKDSVGEWADERLYNSLSEAIENGIPHETYHSTSRISIPQYFF